MSPPGEMHGVPLLCSLLISTASRGVVHPVPMKRDVKMLCLPNAPSRDDVKYTMLESSGIDTEKSSAGLLSPVTGVIAMSVRVTMSASGSGTGPIVTVDGGPPHPAMRSIATAAHVYDDMCVRLCTSAQLVAQDRH